MTKQASTVDKEPSGPQPVMVSLPLDRWEQRLNAEEIKAVMTFMGRATLQGAEAMAFIQCQHKLQALLAAERVPL